MAFAFRSIRSKLLIAFTALALAPLIAYAVLATREATHQLEERAGRALAQAANDTGERLAAYLHERLGDVEVFSSNQIAVTGAPAELAALIDTYVQSFHEYDLIVVTDAAGEVLATNSATGDGKPVDRAAYQGRSMRGQAWYDQIASGTVPRGKSYLSNSELDPLIAEVSHGPGQGFTVSAGIYDASGTLLRVWSNHVSWARSIGGMFDTELKSLHVAGNATIGLSMIDRSGMLIDDADKANVFKHNLVTAGVEFAKRVLAGERGYVRSEDPLDHETDVVGFAPIPTHGAFQANGWAVYAHQEDAEIASATHGLRDFGLIMVAAAIAFVFFAGFLVARTFSRPLVASAATLQRVAGGDLTARAEVKGRDEVAQMNGALNRALERVRNAFIAIGESAMSLSSSSGDLARIGTTLDGSAAETSRQAGVVAAASEQAGKNVQTVAAGTEEMGATIKEIAKNAAAAARVATNAVGSAQRTNELVGKLGESSSQIGNVLNVISTIAEQTNLLALNATIEAARAGEAGKGFAVVANEVKELAKETGKATEDISRKVAAIQADASSAIAAITEISQVIGEINDIQSTIASSVEEQAATTTEISRNVHELAQASGDIARNVTSVATAAGATADCSTQTRAAATTLADLSRRLDGQMSQFTYAEGPSATPAAAMPKSHTTSGTIVRIPMPANVIPRSRSKSTGYSH